MAAMNGEVSNSGATKARPVDLRVSVAPMMDCQE